MREGHGKQRHRWAFSNLYKCALGQQRSGLPLAGRYLGWNRGFAVGGRLCPSPGFGGGCDGAFRGIMTAHILATPYSISKFYPIQSSEARAHFSSSFRGSSAPLQEAPDSSPCRHFALFCDLFFLLKYSWHLVYIHVRYPTQRSDNFIQLWSVTGRHHYNTTDSIPKAIPCIHLTQSFRNWKHFPKT